MTSIGLPVRVRKIRNQIADRALGGVRARYGDEDTTFVDLDVHRTPSWWPSWPNGVSREVLTSQAIRRFTNRPEQLLTKGGSAPSQLGYANDNHRYHEKIDVVAHAGPLGMDPHNRCPLGDYDDRNWR